MKAVIWTRYGPPEVLQLGEVARPVPRSNQVLVRIVAANAFPGDCELRRFDVRFPWSLPVRLLCGLFRPRKGLILGQEYAGEVVEVGSAVTRLRKGDRVFGAGMFGAYAEYIATTGNALVTMPDNLTFEQAAVVATGGLNALHFLRVAGLHKDAPGRKVLLFGAGGSIGTLAVQLARHFGAHVTVVDSGDKLDTLRELGAHTVIDYTREDFTRLGEQWDVVIDIAGKSRYLRALHTVRPGGWFILGNPPFTHLLLRCWSALTSRRRVRFALAGYRLEDLEFLKSLFAAGRLQPVIDRRFPIGQVVEAHRYVESGRRIGNVVLNVSAG